LPSEETEMQVPPEYTDEHIQGVAGRTDQYAQALRALIPIPAEWRQSVMDDARRRTARPVHREIDGNFLFAETDMPGRDLRQEVEAAVARFTGCSAGSPRL
jgi:hypothetical protein